MILYARKKSLRDDRILQLILLMSLLRGSSDLLLDLVSPLGLLAEHDLPLGPSLGQTRFSPTDFAQEFHPKSLDRMLAGYQFSVFQDLNILGQYSRSRLVPTRGSTLGSTMFRSEIQAYLLNAETSLAPVAQNHHVAEASLSNADEASSVNDQEIQRNSHIDDTDNPISSTNDLFEELDLLDAIWKQGGATGFTRDVPPYSDFDDDEDNDASMLARMDSKLSLVDSAILGPFSKEWDFGGEPFPGSEVCEIENNKTWAALSNFTMDTEVADLLLNSTTSRFSNSVRGADLPTLLSSTDEEESAASSSESLEASPSLLLPPDEDDHLLAFSLDEVLNLADFDVFSTPLQDSLKREKDSEDSEADSGCGDSASSDEDAAADADPLDALNESLDQMMHHASLLNPPFDSSHPHARLGGLVRAGAMEHRWQDLASLLSIPSPDNGSSGHHSAQSPPSASMTPAANNTHHHHHHQPSPSVIHHPHPLYPTNDAHGTISPYSSGIPRGVLLHNATLPPPVQDPNNTTYPNSPSFAHSMGASNHISVNNMNVSANCDGQNQTASAHHYKMEVPSSVVGPEMMYYPNCSGGSDIQTTDGFLSSLLNDEDLPLMDIPTNEYNGRPIGEFGPSSSYRYLQVEDPHRLVPVAQKKHQMYGKRFFHDQGHGGAAGVGVVSNLASGGSNSNGTMPLVGSFPSPYTPGVPQSHMEASGVSMNMPEMKYSCALDFRPDISEGAINPVQHNHTYHMPSDGPSGINRPHSKDRRGRRSEVEKHMSRDEKRALALNLPISCDDIINLPMDEFNERISKYDLTEAQLSLIRDIRRRGKNKVAAQNCRKRKLDQIIHLAEEVKVIHYRKSDVQNHVERLKTERNRLKHKFSLLYRHIFQALRDADGNPYSMHEFVLEQTADGNIVLMPRGGPSSEFNSPSSSHGHNETELH